MNPGDMIEWVYKYDHSVVDKDEMLWSSTMKDRVPIGGIALLISVTEEKIVWLSEKGVVPRARG